MLQYVKILSQEKSIGLIYSENNQLIVSCDKSNLEAEKEIADFVRNLNKPLTEIASDLSSLNNYSFVLIDEPGDDGTLDSIMLSFLKSTYNNKVNPNLVAGLIYDLEYGGRLWRSLSRLRMLLKDLVGKDFRSLSKAIFLAEDFNNELDAYMNQCLKYEAAANWLKSDAFKTMWQKIKSNRDEVFSKLVSIQKSLGKEVVTKSLSDYSSEITRHSFS